jgi:mono/diheme cytochrome c family protein
MRDAEVCPAGRSRDRHRIGDVGIGVLVAVAIVYGQYAGCLFAAPPAEPSSASVPADQVQFGRDIQPLLRRCIQCHGAEKQESGLRLDNGTAIHLGGDSGSAVVPGKPDESLLIQAVRGTGDVERMPPEGPPLKPDEIKVLRTWIQQGAVVPKERLQRDKRADHWAFQRPQRPPLPDVADRDWPCNAIDFFVLHRLEQEGIAPSPLADRATQIRRLSLDLLGLPPSIEEVEAFVADDSPDAYERLVDRTLASPAYGERWGRHWLDLARYADSNGYTRDFGREIWKYRDWVIGAVNRDLPFDQFTIEQFAGDLLPNPTLDQLIATGFHRNTLINEEGGTDPEQFRVEAVSDRVETTGAVFLGLTIGCARCHQHKFDPISQREYYQLFAFLNQCDEPTIDAPAAWQVEAGWVAERDAIRKQIDELEQQLATRAEEVAQQRLAWEGTITPEQRGKLPGPLQAALDLAPDKRDEAQQTLVADHFKQSEAGLRAFPQLARIAELRASEPKIPTTMVLRRTEKPRTTFVHRRGDFLDPAGEVQAGVPAVLHPLPETGASAEHPSAADSNSADSGLADSGLADRLDLARWLVDPANPLTPRVIVNRYWQRFFGQGLVATENDFGLQGESPTHPELLDWLAGELLARDWSVKSMHRLLVTSATYRQASRNRPELEELDPKNQLLARQSRVRLDAEIVRDNALAAAGLLSRTVGGPGVHPPQPDGVFQFTQDPKPWNTDTDGNRYRRGMYTFFWRSSPYPALTVFDAPNANVTCTRRNRSNTPLQSLTLANDLTFIECAQALARHLLSTPAESDEHRLRLAFRNCLARSPTPRELQRLAAFVQQQREAFQDDPQSALHLVGDGRESGAGEVELAAWVATARVLLNLDEFITRE